MKEASLPEVIDVYNYIDDIIVKLPDILTDEATVAEDLDQMVNFMRDKEWEINLKKIPIKFGRIQGMETNRDDSGHGLE